MKSIVVGAAVAVLGLGAPAAAADPGGGYATAIHCVPHGGGYGYQHFYGNPAFDHRFGQSFLGTPSGVPCWNGQGDTRLHALAVLPVRMVIRALRAHNFRHITRVRLAGGVYQARARDVYGRRVQLAIDPYCGAVIGLRYR